MPSKKKSESFFPVLEHIDRICARSFARASIPDDNVDNILRFKIYLRLLDSFRYDTPGFNEIDKDLVYKFVDQDEADLLKDILPKLAGPTYIVTSYWSPLDERRHSIYHRYPIKTSDQRRALAYAFAFYALTFEGSPTTGPYEEVHLYSATQFISRHAERKMSPPLCFDEMPPKDVDLWWHIPENLHQRLLDETGLGSQIEQKLVQNLQITTDSIESALRSTLVNTEENEWNNLDNFAKIAIDEYLKRWESIPHDIRCLAESTATKLEGIFSSKVTPCQALFMLVTHIIWRNACPGTKCAYTFPTRVSGTCCVFTIGSRRALNQQQLGLLACMSKALFMHPLIEDYSIKATDEKAKLLAHTKQNAFRKLIGHNLPKFLITPTNTKLDSVTNLLNISKRKRNHQQTSIDSAITIINDLQFLLTHYESFLHAFASSDRLKSLITGEERPKLINLNELTESIDRIFYGVISDRLANISKRKYLKLQWELPVNCSVYCDKILLREVLFNVLTNSVDALKPSEIRKDSPTSVIHIKIQNDDAQGFTTISVIDKGCGFSPIQLNNVRGMLHELWAVEEKEFWTIADRHIELALAKPARDDCMGIGLIFCGVFLRQIQWTPGFRRPGFLDIESEEDCGTTVRIGIPD